MESVQVLHNHNIKKIAIVDDDINAAEVTSWQVEDAGFEPLIVDDTFGSVNQLSSFIQENAHGALCDHRLSHRGFANFYGANLVATLYDLRMPAILVTQYIEIDKDVSIRRWRHKIPVLLSRDETDELSIKKGLRDCILEIKGDVPSPRKPYRTLLRITNIDDESNERVVDVIIPSWNPHRAVRFPVSIMPNELHDKLVPDLWLFSYVNIGAEKSDDLFFDQFELAPEPDDDGLA
jgi:hypothetical protein